MGDKSISLNTAGIVDGESIAWAGAIEIAKTARTPTEIFRMKCFLNELVPKSRNENI